ncbi:Heat-labile enterotoxin IIB, A chain [Metarhizium album ARSEF 1941]|uniref:Heat-labile enterotoxin IIB, A chain n=1 Tax=Metarhizium album (strain ARSEF 1941) TaxID=1081103 RepID=A0A0B2X802_METAS|nr:Heat-labile enterotoxin IIB, A chain [Metarhizium album ARSEF 1941]KHO01883.1 Heat-labile enterotoxin IIB, A chain [Metarhizium album ARSEF 1941]
MKLRHWVLTTLAFSLGLCHSRPGPGASVEATLERRQWGNKPAGDYDEASPRHVYRGEVHRTPEKVKEEGGFYSRGLQKSLSGGLDAHELEEGSSLFRHAAGETPEVTRYVSTSADPAVSLTFAVDDDNPTVKGYIYKIHADKKMVDVNRSLGKYSLYPGQYEHAALGYIPYEQVEGWWSVTYGEDFSDRETGMKTQKELRQGTFRGFQRNPTFDSTSFQKLRGKGPAPQLAGFPPLSTAWEEETWRNYRGLRVSTSLDDMLLEACRGRDGCDLEKITPKTPAGTPGKAPGAPKGPVTGAMDPTKRKRLLTGFRAYQRAGTLAGFKVVAPLMRGVLDLLRGWDHPVGEAVRWLDDHIDNLQEEYFGPRRNDISGNDNQAALINFFRKIFWALQLNKKKPEQLKLLSYGRKNKMRLVSVNAILRTCDRVDEQPPEEPQLGMKLQNACHKMRKETWEVEAPTEEELRIGREVCINCALKWEPDVGFCRDKNDTIIWPREPIQQMPCHDDNPNCGGGTNATELQIGQATCEACGDDWDPEEGKCWDVAGLLLWPWRMCAFRGGRVECEYTHRMPESVTEMVEITEEEENERDAPETEKPASKMIKGLRVAYGDRPRDAVREIADKSDDINHGFGGEYVWLVPEYTLDPDEACTAFMTSTRQPKEGHPSVTKGAEGTAMYIRCAKAPDGEKIRRAMLVRGLGSEERVKFFDNGTFDGETANLNWYRGTDKAELLYLVWSYSEGQATGTA